MIDRTFPRWKFLMLRTVPTYRLPIAILTALGLALVNSTVVSADTSDLKVVFLAGNASHGYGAHEHLAGSRVLAAAIEEASDSIDCVVIPGGWPEDETVLDDADAIVMYCDGGKRHPALPHLKTLQKQTAWIIYWRPGRIRISVSNTKKVRFWSRSRTCRD